MILNSIMNRSHRSWSSKSISDRMDLCCLSPISRKETATTHILIQMQCVQHTPTATG